jgi:hypothetical protein
MIMEDFEVFKSFYSEEQALDLQMLLKENGIETKIERKRIIIDKVIMGDGVETDIYLMLKAADFSRAEQVIDDSVTKHINEIEPDYYLFSFSKEELLEIVRKPDEWNNQDVILARKILSDGGYVINENEVSRIKSTRLKELAIQDNELPSLLLLGYVLAATVPLYGIFFGLTKLTAKKVLPDGSKTLIYNSGARNHYIAMMILGIILLTGLLFYVYTPDFL